MGSGFLEGVKAFFKGNEQTLEIPKAQRYAVKPSLHELFLVEEGNDRGLKDEAIVKAYTHYSYTVQEIALR